jgi:hypothetical protein
MNTLVFNKILLVSVLFFSIKTNVFGQGGTTYVMSNSAVSIGCDAWVVDPDSLRGNYPIGDRVMVITSASGNKLGIQLDSFYLREDGEYIAVYDGPTTSSPLLTNLGKGCLPCPSWDPGVKSSGSVVTIVFHAVTPFGPPSSWGWRLRIRCIEDITQTADFLPVFQATNMGNIRLNDYDKDGDKDALVGGVVYRNDSRDDSLYVFDRIVKPIGNWENANMVAADFDNDGWKDIFITGEIDSAGLDRRRAMIFRNVNGTLTAGSTSTFLPAILGAVSIVDYNNDGKIDIAYSGYLGNTPVFLLYLNNGNFNFTGQPTDLPGLFDASMSWNDYDNDGDQDLLYNGQNGTTQTVTGLFINNANNTFSNAGLVMYNTYNGDIRWVDVNKDGKYDIVNSGRSPAMGGIAPEILFNNGDKTFTRVITNLPARSGTHFDWADYDNDGDMDIALTGISLNNNDVQIDAAVYKNNGNGNFSKKSIGGVSSRSTPKWVDFNKDGRWDLFVPARDINPSLFYKNMGADSFYVSSYPFTAYETIGVALAEDFTNDGFVDALFAGELNDQNCEEGEGSVLIKSLGWRVFPTAILTKIVDLNENVNWGSVHLERYWRWGDINSDGNDDIIVSPDADYPNLIDSLRIFKNNGNGTFSQIYSGYPAPNQHHSQVGVVDINNDGVNELYVVPNALYRWNGTGFTQLYNDQNGYCGPNGCNKMYFDFADFNKDGFMDVAYTASGLLRFLKSNGTSRFDIVQALNLGADRKYLKWSDYDNDGDPDLLTSSYSSSNIFENTAYGGFRARDVDIPPHLHTGVADLNGDGWEDIFAIQYRTEIGPAKLFYNQQGKLFFQDKTPPGFIQINNGATHEGAEAYDIDNDGDNDLLYATHSDCSYSGIYLNNKNIRTPNLIIRNPNGNENFTIGSTQTIKWIGNEIGSTVKIELSLDSGITWIPIITNAPSSKYGGQYQWPVTGVTASPKCLVRITDNGSNSLIDKSNKTFTLSVLTAIDNPMITQHMRLYPNPLYNNFFNIETRAALAGKKAIIQVFNTTGTLVEVKNIIAQTGVRQIDLKNLPKGIYLIKITIGKETGTYKIIKL